MAVSLFMQLLRFHCEYYYSIATTLVNTKR